MSAQNGHIRSGLLVPVERTGPRPPARKPKLIAQNQDPNLYAKPIMILDLSEEKDCCKSKGKSTYLVITGIILAVIGGLVAMGLTGQFTSDGWLCKVAFPAIKKGFDDFAHWVVNTAIPAIRKFLDMKANLTVGQGLLYIGLPVVGAGAVAALGCKYGPGVAAHFTEKLKVNQEEQAQTALITQILEFHEALDAEEMAAQTTSLA